MPRLSFLVDIGNARLVGAIHGPGMKDNELVAVEVRGDETLSGKSIVQHAEMIPAQAMGIHPFRVGPQVAPHCLRAKPGPRPAAAG